MLNSRQQRSMVLQSPQCGKMAETEMAQVKTDRRPLPSWPYLVFCAGLGFTVLCLTQGGARVPPLWWLVLAPHALIGIGLVRGGFDLPTRWTTMTQLGLSWSFGMICELTLTADGTRMGGKHAGMRSCFVLAQGDDIPFAVATLWMVRRWHLAFAGAFWLAFGNSLTEGIVCTGILSKTILQQF